MSKAATQTNNNKKGVRAMATLVRSLTFSPVASFSLPSHCLNHNQPPSYLDQARELEPPSREQMLRRDPSARIFWEHHEKLLEQAWAEWAKAESLPVLDSSLYHPKLRKAIEDAWNNPSGNNEKKVRDLWEPVAPGVYQCQFFDPDKIGTIRAYLDEAAEAGIPARPPHGIVLNRKGIMIDPRSSGYLAIPEFQAFYRDLMDTYMRPLGRLFFPEHIKAEDDTESFAFSIQYQAGKDQSIRQHTDASSVTLNINLNLPGEEFSGSKLYFVDQSTGAKNLVEFARGVAVMHRGATPHAALPITCGERSNLVLWLYGQHGPANPNHGYGPDEQLTAQERWTKPDLSPEHATSTYKWSPEFD